jgi:hypothetical protein
MVEKTKRFVTYHFDKSALKPVDDVLRTRFSDKVILAVKAFEEDNAKQLSTENTVRYFVPPEKFHDLFARKNHILLGSRGSGKTTWVRMLAHDHILLASKLPGAIYQYARDALEQNMIGIYVPTNIGLVGSLKNKPWQSEEDAENFFQWRLNLHSCAAILPVIRSCIDYYVKSPEQRAIAELRICGDLGRQWLSGDTSSLPRTLEGLGMLLATIETQRLSAISRVRATGVASNELYDYFDSDLFQPIKFAIRTVAYYIGIPGNATWMVCIDEAEYLTEAHHRILNTHLRTAAGDLVFKIATMPFAHHTLATNIGDPVREGHDFEYIYVDHVPIDSRGATNDAAFLKFAREVFKRRTSKMMDKKVSLSLSDMLGPSPLIDEKSVETDEEIKQFMLLLEKFGNEATLERARRLLTTDIRKFRNEILRKMHGALLLREAMAERVGNAKLKIYSGESMVVRCSDGNPRRLMRLLNAMLKKVVSNSDGELQYPLSPAVQNEVLESVARDALNRVQSEPPDGVITHKFLSMIGMQMARTFNARRLGSDFISSISVAVDDGEQIQHFVKQAVQLSLLTPSIENSHNGPNAPCHGVFHLGFIFSPLFGLLPRRNKSQRLPQILAAYMSAFNGPVQQFSLEI